MIRWTPPLFHHLSSPSHGPATAVSSIFEGVVRDNARGRRVRYLEYDAYPEMARARNGFHRRRGRESMGYRSSGDGASYWTAGDRRVQRRDCRACPHRAEAFAACQYAIDTLKTTVPIFKKEVLDDGEEWVEG